MKKGISKKGAMELSINTIVVVVIGITLLVLGLVFVREIFTKLGDLSGGAFQKAEQELKQIQSGDTKINFPATIEIKKGKASTQDLLICNTDGTLQPGSLVKLEPLDFYTGLRVKLGGKVIQGTTAQTFVLGTVDYQSCRPFPVLVTAIPNIIVDPATTPFLTISVEKGSSVYASIGTIITIV